MSPDPKSPIAPLLALCLAAACSGGGAATTAGTPPNGGNPPANGLPATLGEFRLNQLGYLPADTRLALLLSHDDLRGQSFLVRDAGSGALAYAGAIGRDRGAYASFAHLYELDFSACAATGTFVLVCGDRRSPPFAIGDATYRDLIGSTLQFFAVQRCGATNPSRHGPCHLTDGIGSGGWHDAGDYMKFNLTIGTACDFLLTAFARHPEAFADSDRDGVPDVLAEAKVGIDWLLQTWDPLHGVLYHQVADASDHGQWRMPELDDLQRPNRPVFACEPGRGANCAGKSAAALALAAVLFGDASQSFHDAGRSSRCRTAALEIYGFGQANPEVQSEAPFYPETSWQDDMALAAAELYRLTRDGQYLVDARSYARSAGNAWDLRYADLNALAHYEIARLDPGYVPTAAGYLAADLDNAQYHGNREPFGGGMEEFYWGSGMVMLGNALEALYYQDLTGDPRYRQLAQDQRDFLLGRNAWGVCFAAGAGTRWPRHPHHQVADLTGGNLTGFWGEGPVTQQVFLQNIATLDGPDTLAAFQTIAAVYHDDRADYTTNEIGIEPAAMGIAMTSWYWR